MRKPPTTKALKREGDDMVCSCGLASFAAHLTGMLCHGVREWAQNVWNAYYVYHDLAKNWIEEVKKSHSKT